MNKKLILGVLLSILTPMVLASERKFFSARSAIGVGAAYQKADAELRATVGDLPERSVDLDDLALGDEDWSWALEWRWRFTPRWILVALAYQYDQEGNRTAQRDFNFDGKEFQAGASLDTELQLNTYILDVMYSVYSTDRTEVFIGGGIHAIDLEASISGRAFVGDQERQNTTGSSELLAPLPNFRAQVFHSMGNRWGLSVAMGWLSANYEDYDGSFAYIHPRIGYAFAERWAFTVGYQYVDVDLTHEKSDNREAEFNMDFQGPTVLLNYRF